MKLYTIFFNGSTNLYKGYDGRFWLGGSVGKLDPTALIFTTRKQAANMLKLIKQEVATDPVYKSSILKDADLSVGRCEIVRA